MPLIAFRKNVDERRLRRVARVLQEIQAEIERESAELRVSEERMTACAAFSLEVMENDENPEHLSAKIETLTRNLAVNHGQVSLEEQISIVNGTRAGLQRVLASHRA